MPHGPKRAFLSRDRPHLDRGGGVHHDEAEDDAGAAGVSAGEHVGSDAPFQRPMVRSTAAMPRHLA
jgi:hypothetical protein